MAGQRDKGGGAKKYGRKKDVCKAYFTSSRRDVNKAKRYARHLRRFPWDKRVRQLLHNLGSSIRKRAGVKMDDLPSRQSPVEERAELGVTMTTLKRRGLWG